MKLQDQVCTMQQGRRLIELGIEPISIFSHYIIMPSITGDEWHYDIGLSEYYDSGTLQERSSPAFTVAELGVLLPSNTASYLPLGEKDKWWTDHKFIRHDVTDDSCLAPTEAQSRAALLVHLLETNQITADEANKRLESHE